MIGGRHRIFQTVAWSWRVRVANPGPQRLYHRVASATQPPTSQRRAASRHTYPAPQAASGAGDRAVAAETPGDATQTPPSSEPRPSADDHLSPQAQAISLRHLHTSPVLFDTHQTIQELQRGGYGLQQAEVLVTILNDVVRSTLAASSGAQLSEKDLEVLELRVRNSIHEVKNNLLLLEKSTVATLRSENEALKAQMQRLKADLLDEVGKVQSGSKLDSNLEKSRSKEELTMMQQKIKDIHNTIGTQAAQLRTQIEAQKVESIKYLAGGLFSVITLVLTTALGLWRLMK